MKTCAICDCDISGLYHNSKRCKSPECKRISDNAKAQKHHALHPEKNIERIRNYSKTERGRAVLLLNNAKDRAKKSGHKLEIDVGFVLEKLKHGHCEITGIPFDLLPHPDKYRANPFSPSLDRIVPVEGYTATNVRMVLFAVNVMHHDWSDDIMLQLATSVVHNHTKLKLSTTP